MPVDTILHNAKVYTTAGLIEAGIAIDKDRIVKIAKRTNLPKATAQIDLKGNFALPGLIDSHVHLRDQELSFREDFTTGTCAAAAGGVTTVVDMPNNRPITMSVETIRERMQLAEPRLLVNVAFNSAFPTQLDDIHRIVKAGAIGFKLYLLEQIGGVDINDSDALLKAFKAACRARVPIAVHAEDQAMIEQAQKSLMKRGREDLEAFVEAHKSDAEEKAVKRATELSGSSGAHLHVCHVSSKKAMKAVSTAKKLGYHVTCEVTPHHLLLTTEHLRKYGNLALEIPPLRSRRDAASLWRSIQKDSVDTIASDHAPHSWDGKTAGSVWDVKPGIVGLETMLPLLLTQVNKRRLTLQQLVHLTCEKPAGIYHIESRGSLSAGSFADITVVELKKEGKIDASNFYSKAKFSPFDGWKIKGLPVKTFVNGQLVMDEGRVIPKLGSGALLR